LAQLRQRPLPSGVGALDEPLRAFPSWFLRIVCDRCGKERMISETHMAQGEMLIRDIIERMRHDGWGGRAGKVELLTGIEGSAAARCGGSCWWAPAATDLGQRALVCGAVRQQGVLFQGSVSNLRDIWICMDSAPRHLRCSVVSDLFSGACMSLVVASAEGGSVWMVSDAAISDPKNPLRLHCDLPKVEVSHDRAALVGFAGNNAHGAARLTRQACAEAAGDLGLRVLIRGSRDDANVEFAYAFLDPSGPRLFRVVHGAAEPRIVVNLGSKSALGTFQRIRHGELDPYAPNALKTFMCHAEEQAVPAGLRRAIVSMLDLFVTRTERDVGGLAIPYLLTKSGPRFCAYGYGVSDPIFDQIVPGSLIPHGTPEGGGTSLSVTQSDDGAGIVAYWRQLPGGLVLLRSADGYERYDFAGSPMAFKDAVRTTLGRSTRLWVEDQEAGPVKALAVVRTEDDRLTAVIADHGDARTIAVHNLSTPFHFLVELSMKSIADGPDGAPWSVRLSEDKRSVHLELRENEAEGVTIGLKPDELEALIRRLGYWREKMADQVPLDHRAVTETFAVPNPVWRLERSPHPALGCLLSLRHTGFGWLSFVLPDHEARSMGRGLVGLVESAAAREPTSDAANEHERAKRRVFGGF
jgi:hypothetical protein